MRYITTYYKDEDMVIKDLRGQFYIQLSSDDVERIVEVYNEKKQKDAESESK